MAVELKIIYNYYAGINGSFANKPSQSLELSKSSSTILKSRHHPSKKMSTTHSSSNRSIKKTSSHSTKTTAAYTSTYSTIKIQYSLSTPSASSSPLPSQKNLQNTSLSSGTVVGITFSIICAIALVIFVYFFFVIRKARNRNYPTNRQSYLDVVVGQSDCPSSIEIEGSPSSYNHTVLHNEKIYVNTTPSSLLTTSTKKTYVVTSSYTQTLDDELFIQPGDKVQIFNEYDDGWCLGKNLTRGGARGVLPQNCLDKN